MTFPPFGTTGMGLTLIGVGSGHVIKRATHRLFSARYTNG